MPKACRLRRTKARTLAIGASIGTCSPAASPAIGWKASRAAMLRRMVSSSSHPRSRVPDGLATSSAARIAATRSANVASPGGSQSRPRYTMPPIRLVARNAAGRNGNSGNPAILPRGFRVNGSARNLVSTVNSVPVSTLADEYGDARSTTSEAGSLAGPKVSGLKASRRARLAPRARPNSSAIRECRLETRAWASASPDLFVGSSRFRRLSRTAVRSAMASWIRGSRSVAPYRSGSDPVDQGVCRLVGHDVL